MDSSVIIQVNNYKNRKVIPLKQFTKNVSKLKINEFGNLLKSQQIKLLLDNIFKTKKDLSLNSNNKKYLLNIILNFSNKKINFME